MSQTREKSDEEVVRALVLSRTRPRLQRPRSLSTRPLSEFQQRGQQEKASEAGTATEVASLSLNERGRVRYRQPPTGVLNSPLDTKKVPNFRPFIGFEKIFKND